MWKPWPLRTESPFMANITTWMYMPWDGRYTFDLTANDEASLVISRSNGARVPLRGVTARRVRHAATQAVLLRQAYNLDEGSAGCL